MLIGYVDILRCPVSQITHSFPTPYISYRIIQVFIYTPRCIVYSDVYYTQWSIVGYFECPIQWTTSLTKHSKWRAPCAVHHVGHDFHGGVTLSADVTPTVTCTARSWFFFSVCELRCWTSVISVSPYASQITSSRDMEAVTFKKLVKGHAYSVTAVDEVRKKGLQKWLLTTDMKGNVDQLQSSFSVITGLFVNLLKNFSSKTKLSMLHSNMEKRNKHTEP